MSAALLLNPLHGAAPVDPARPLLSGDGDFAGVLADATAAVAGAGGDPANAPAEAAAPAVAPAPANAVVINSLLPAEAGEGLTTPADLTAPEAPTSAEAGLTPVAVVPTLVAPMPSLSGDLPAAAGLPVAAAGDSEPPEADAPLTEAPALAGSSPVATAPEGLTTSASAAPAAAIVADARGVPAANGAVQAQLAAMGAGLATKPTARRTDAPAASGAAQSTMALVPAGSADSAELAVEPEPATPVTSSSGALTLNGQAAAAGPQQGAVPGAPAQAAGAAAAKAEAKPVAVLAEAGVELISLEAPTDLPAGETTRLPETLLPTASSIVLQSMVNDGRFNAVAQISAQILRRLEGQTTRFELALTPEDLGRVDVMLEIDGDGAVTARLAFDNPAAAAELRAQADQLRRELEAAGLNVGRDGLQFAERDARRDDSGSDRRRAKAFAGAARLEADADAGVGAYRMITADGRLDVRI